MMALQLRAAGKNYHEISTVLHRTESSCKRMHKDLVHLTKELHEKLVRYLSSCSDSQISVNLLKVTKAMQPHFTRFNSMVIDLSDSYWQSIITRNMAESLHSLNFQTTSHSVEHLDIPHEDVQPESASTDDLGDDSNGDGVEEDYNGSPGAALQLLNRTSVSQVAISEGSDDDAKHRMDPDDIVDSERIDEHQETEYMGHGDGAQVEESQLTEHIENGPGSSDHVEIDEDDGKGNPDDPHDDGDGGGYIDQDIWTQIERDIANGRSPSPQQMNDAESGVGHSAVESNHGFASSNTFMIAPDAVDPQSLGNAPSPCPPPDWVSIPVRWRGNSNFVVKTGIATTQITKRGSSYSSIYTLEPMMARKFKYSFILSNVEERGKPWIGIGIVSSKCPFLKSGRWPTWHASNRYSLGWYYGASIWHDHNAIKSKYGCGRYWRSGDEIEMTVDCTNYTVSYAINGKDLGVAVRDFNKLLDSPINAHYYAIVSIQRGQNALTLMNAFRSRNMNRYDAVHEDGGDPNGLHSKDNPNGDRKWKSFFKFNRKSKGNALSLSSSPPTNAVPTMRRMQSEMIHNRNHVDGFSIEEAAGARLLHSRSKSEDAKTFLKRMQNAEDSKSEEHSGSSRLEELSQEVDRLRTKCETQTRMMVAMKQRCESTVTAYRRLEKEHVDTRKAVGRWKEEAQSNKKELSLSRGAMHELKRMDVASLRELQGNLFASLQNVQKAISLHYESKYECRICMSNQKDTVLIPCGHFLCGECALKVTECPMCRAQIGRTLQLN